MVPGMEGATFARAVLERLGPAATGAGAEVEPQLARAFDELRAALPGLALAPAEFAAHLARHLAKANPPARAPATLHASELLLAFACARAVPGAIEELERRHGAAIDAAIRGLDASAAFGDEVRQQLRERLFVGHGSGREPAIAGYSGAGALGGWLQLAARRTALNHHQRDPHAPGAARPQGGEEDALLEARAPQADPELEHLKATCRPQFEAAFKEALGTLTVRERNLLRLRYLDGVNGQKLAGMYAVDASNISRALAGAREKLQEETRRRLIAALGLTASQLQGVLGLLLSRLDLSLSTALGRRAPPQ